MFRVKTVLFFFFIGLLQISINAFDLVTENSECIRLEDCPHINKLVRTKKDSFGVTTLMNLLHCHDKRRQIYIKCIDPPKVEDFMKKADMIPNSDSCGRENLKPKIAQGNVTAIDDYPWIALLRYQTAWGNFTYGCHGNLISQRYILTVAHCLHPDQLRRKNITIYSVILGEYDTTTDRDCMGKDCVTNQTKELLVESYDIHHDYNSLTFVNDIGLIRMNSEVEYTDFIKPICLPPNILIPPFNEPLWIAGWGYNEQNVMNTIKVDAVFYLNQRDSCLTANVNLTSKQFCARSKNLAKTCPGDSGGPLMKRIKSRDSERLILVGVDSLGIDCSSFIRHFAIYTKVSEYIEWILNTIHE